jgi:putative membrane-bound dehydrogenase-like protein
MSNDFPPRALFARVVMFGGLVGLLAWSDPGFAQVSPEESASKVKPAEGLEASLWAAEPMVVNPTNMDIDSRGRVWVSEGLNYRLTRNKSLPRLDEADRIKILEDTDGDGKADKMTVFADHIFPVPMGLAVEEHYGNDGKYQGCKVYIGNSPDLLVLEDTDGDDKADKRYPLLTGFGGVDSDHGVHGMVLGLDGKLYFTHGDGCCTMDEGKDVGPRNFNVIDKGGRHVWTDQLANTLRVNRDGTEFEILADRQRNNYETCLNAFGNIFTSDNDDDGHRGCRVIWVMDGGHYGYRTPGSPRHWGEEVPGNVPKLVGTGNGSPCGIMVYEGSLLPKEYLGGVFEADAGTRQINFFPLTRKGASFRTEYKVLLASDDPWFRPVDQTAAPDGSVFVADWYDGGVGGHQFRDQTTGRIYRVAPQGVKTKKIESDFATVAGLIAALKSPVVATQDSARRGLIARGQEAAAAISEVFNSGDPIFEARAFWVLHAIRGDEFAIAALRDSDARIREQAVRILGRDDRENGHVDESKATVKTTNAAEKNLAVLLPLASDPDAGVRRELILALRNLPTNQVGGALKTLARSWDGQDRWYLEALGLALDNRETSFIAELFDGTLYSNLNLPASGAATHMALPPYFPVDRNEAFLATGEAELPASPLTKTLGLAWRVHRREVLPLWARITPQLVSPELQQAADDVLAQIGDAAAAPLVAELVGKTNDVARKRLLLSNLARRLDGSWRAARNDAKVAQAIKDALDRADTRIEGIQLVAASGDARYGGLLASLAQDESVSEPIRVAAVDAIGALRPASSQHVLTHLIGSTKGKATSNLVAEAAVRSLPKLFDAHNQLIELITSDAHPLALRRQALRTLAQSQGAMRLIALAKEGKLPDVLRTEATTVLYANPDNQVRAAAAGVLPPPKTASGRTLPPIGQLLRREGEADRGRAIFFRSGTNTCASCHRVQGRGQWIGPDLSTIGTKYGKDELLHSILNPSAAIGYNNIALVVGLKDGRVLMGLPIEQTADRLVLKTADGQRVAVRAADIEEKKQSETSLMPDGLAETMSDTDLVDLLAFLATLKEPVSIVGQYQAVGPLAEKDAAKLLDGGRIDVTKAVPGPAGQQLAWRRLSANAESLVDLTSLAGDESSHAALLYSPVVSPSNQEARLVLDTKAPVKVWFDGRPLDLPAPSADQPRVVAMELAKGRHDLLISVSGGSPEASLVTTFVTHEPLEFTATN